MTLTPEKLQSASEDIPNKINEINSTRFAMGWITGVYPGEKKEKILSVGPHGEMAWADKYAVFYKNGTFDFWEKPCFWPNHLPQGFSCAVGAEPNDCSDERERFVPVECDKIVLKVAKKISRCNGDPDCFEGVDWD